MTVTWVEDDGRLVAQPEREPEQRSDNIWEVTRVAAARSPIQVSASRSISSAKFLPHSYLDDAGHLHNGNRVSHLMRIALKWVNNVVLMLGVLVGAVGGAGLVYFGYPTLGISFSALILFGAWAQRRAFDYQRLYGVWHGFCPSCKELLNISAKGAKAKTVTCSNCASCVARKDGVFRIAPWRTQFLER